MDFQFPISEETANGLSGTLAFYRNLHGSNEFSLVSERKILRPREFVDGNIEVAKGKLVVSDRRGVWAEFNAAEWNGASRFARGRFVREMTAGQRDRQAAAMTVKQPFGDEPFGICISTCAAYADKTIPTVLRSLARLRIGGDRIRVVMGGEKQDSDEDAGGIPLLRRIASNNAMNGLEAVDGSFRYWLLMEDTSELTAEAFDRIRLTDVSLCPDVILAAAQSWMGLYRAEFITGLRTAAAANGWANAIPSLADTIVSPPAEKTTEEHSLRDIYGLGIRSVFRTPLGIRKFSSRTLREVKRS